MEHRLDLRRLLAPTGLQLVQLVGQMTVLSLEESHLVDVVGKPLVQVLQNIPSTIRNNLLKKLVRRRKRRRRELLTT